MNKRALFSVLGYVLFLFGMISLVLGLVGLSFVPLSFLDVFGQPVGFFLRLVTALLGLIILYVARVERE